MAQYRKDIKVKVIRPTKPLVMSDFTKVLFISDEIDAPIKRYATLEQLAVDFSKTSKLYEAVEIALSQTDFDGNMLGTDYFFAGGFVPTAGSFAELETLLTNTEETGFYGIVLPFYDKAILEKFALWLNREVKFAVVVAEDETGTIGQLSDSDRMYFLYKEAANYPFDAFGLTGHTLMKGPAARWKDRRVVGTNPSVPNDVALESKLLEANINSTITKYGFNAVTNGSWTANGIMHADQRIKLDSIVHDIEYNLGRLLVMEENLFYDSRGIEKIAAVIDRVMTIKGQENIVAKDDDGRYLYSIVTPSMNDSNPETGITVDDIIDRTLRNLKVNFTMSSEIETVDITLVWYDEPITRVGGNE